jgi:hypothetical protein
VGGYTMQVAEVGKAVTMLTSDATHADNANADVAAIPALPAPQAGTSIGPDLTAFKSGWKEALGDIKAEMTGLAGKVDTSKDVTIKVERLVGNRFDQFTR